MNSVVKNGSAGGDYITVATGAVSGKQYASVHVLEDGTTFSTLTNTRYGGTALTSRTYKRGDVVWGLTTEITVSAGEVHALLNP